MAQEPPRIADYLKFDDERPFIHKAMDRRLSDADRLDYARLVEARDPERAEWLRLEVALHARAADDPAVVARFIELGRKIGFEYANLLLRDKIMNCGSEEAKRSGPRVRFAFACTKRWETLAPTDSASVRLCQQCKERVYHCDTIADAESRALAGQCIAVPKELSDGGVETEMLGRPEPVRPWADRLFSGGPRGPDSDLLVTVYSRGAEALGSCYTLGASPAATTVGRGADNTIVLPGDSVSRCHARFERRADGWWVIDNGSTNGTYVNDAQVREARLRRGDMVRIGETILKLVDTRPIFDTTYAPSQIDGLTGLYTRRHLGEQIDCALSEAADSGRPLALLMFDLDFFKKLNDTHGHPAGDQVLREFSALLRQHARPGDVAVRYGGEEFALLLPDTDREGAAAIGEQIRAAVATHPFTVGAHTIAVTVSAGVAQANANDRSADGLIRAADQALYAAKLAGRNTLR